MKLILISNFIFMITISCFASDQGGLELNRINKENLVKRSKEMDDYRALDKNWARSEAFIKFSIKQENEKFDDESKMFTYLCKTYKSYCEVDRKDERDRRRKYNIYRFTEEFKNYKLIDEKNITYEIFKQKADEYWIDFLNLECKKFNKNCLSFTDFSNEYKNKFHKSYEPNKNYEIDRDKAVSLNL